MMPSIRNIASFRRPSKPQVWTVEPTAVQITWGELPAGLVTASTGDRQCTIDHEGGPGSVVVDQLTPNTDYQIKLASSGAPKSATVNLQARTNDTPHGEMLSRFATISDLHIGATRWGALRTMSESPSSTPGHPYRLAYAAIFEAIQWGAELLVIKGDAANHEKPTMFDELGKLVDAFPDLPMILIPGNHDVDEDGVNLPLTIGERNLAYTRKIDWYDLAGLRVIAADSTVPGKGWVL